MRDINTYLTDLSNNLKVEKTLQEKIQSSFNNLEGLLFKEFKSELDTVSIFGSYDRGTAFALPGNAKNFDVDILITFRKDQYHPETYLKKIKNLGQQIYPRSGVSADFPSVAVEMNHVKFELVPAIKTGSGTEVKIPATRGKEEKWVETNPEKFKKTLLDKDEYEKGMIIPLIKLIKYWNSCNGGYFYSWDLEKFITDRSYSSCRILKDYFYEFISDISGKGKDDNQTKAIENLAEKGRRLKVLEKGNVPEFIETELNSFIPFIN